MGTSVGAATRSVVTASARPRAVSHAQDNRRHRAVEITLLISTPSSVRPAFYTHVYCFSLARLAELIV